MQDTNTDPSDIYNDNDTLSDSPVEEHSIKKKKKSNFKYNPEGNLPHEILNFINTDSYSLLVKGKPGTGKTTFALTLMDSLYDENNYFYISTRLSTKQLFYYYPWIKKFFSIEGKEFDYKFEDARLDEPESLFERITNQLMDVKSPIILIDTWDTIASFMDRESRLNNERVLQIWRERAGAKLVFLSESEDFGILDSLVDGVISLNYQFVKSQRVRELILHKLRGIQIENSKYHFSIKNGIFYTLDPISNLNLFNKINFQTSKPLGVKSNRKYINNSIKNQKKENENIIDPFFDKELVFLIFDRCFGNDLILSIIFKTLYLHLINNGIILTNNFNTDFQFLCIKLFTAFFNDENYKQNILHNKIDFSLILQHGNTDNFLSTLVNNFIKNKPFDQYSVGNIVEKKILNILHGNSIINLVDNYDLLEVISKSFFRNIVIFTKPVNFKNIRLSSLPSKSGYYEFFIKGSNIIVKSKNGHPLYYGITSFNNDGLLQRWIPIY